MNPIMIPNSDRPHGMRKQRATRGFSLTEIAIALATVSVSLVALLGLVSVSIQTGQSSAHETCLASASRQALDALRSRGFGDLPIETPHGNETKAAVLPTIYLSDDGQWLAPDRDKWPEANVETQRPLEAVYQCVVSIEPDAGTLTPKIPKIKDEDRVNLLRVKLELGSVDSGRTTTNSTIAPAVLIHATLPRQ